MRKEDDTRISLQAVNAFDELYAPVCDSCGEEVVTIREHAVTDDGKYLCRNCLFTFIHNQMIDTELVGTL